MTRRLQARMRRWPGDIADVKVPHARHSGGGPESVSLPLEAVDQVSLTYLSEMLSLKLANDERSPVFMSILRTLPYRSNMSCTERSDASYSKLPQKTWEYTAEGREHVDHHCQAVMGSAVHLPAGPP